MDSSAAPTLREVYERQLRARGYSADAAQLRAIDCLEDLRGRMVVGGRADAHPIAARLLRRLAGRPSRPQRGIYLWGPVGRGKTWLMDLFFQSLPFPERRRRHFHRFMHDVHAELNTLRDRTEPLAIIAERLARQSRILCLDELFVADIADAMILAGLFSGLFRHGVTLVATSNVPPRDQYRNGLQRQRFLAAIELIERHTRVVAVDGEHDYRLRQLTQAGTYLTSDDRGGQRRLHALFAQLAQHADWDDEALEINGRAIPVVRQSNGAVWFDFEALCAGPRSQEDYIEIARLYSAVVLSGVPRLDTTREDEARRFIALIDELYDRHVKLVICAIGPPQTLYRGERLRSEFQRTTSRLAEMQSAEYLAGEHLP